MDKLAVSVAALALALSSLACTSLPQIPDVNINVPKIEVGEMREERRSIPLSGTDPVDVDVVFGAGRLELEAGVSDELFSGTFRYNVERWDPEITYEVDHLTVKQGGDEGDWGIPSGSIKNRWELEFSPEVPLTMDVRVGAGEGEFDLTDLRISGLDVVVGAGDYALRFDEPNPVAMDHLALDAGASKVEIVGVGHASPETMRIRGGVGEISLDLTGDWTRSSEIKVRAGAGALILRLPKDVGVEVETSGGLTNVEAFGLRQMGGTYTNDAFGETEIELRISVTTGVGNVRLIEEGTQE